jgi:hypothetical protein
MKVIDVEGDRETIIEEVLKSDISLLVGSLPCGQLENTLFAVFSPVGTPMFVRHLNFSDTDFAQHISSFSLP